MSRAPKAEQKETKRDRERERERPGEKSACESLGATQQSPQQTNRLLGPCGQKRTLEAKRNQTGGGLSPSAREGHSTPYPHSGRGSGRERVKPQNRKNNRPKNEHTPLPPSVQEKGLRGVPRESKKRAGPRMAPRRNPRTKRTHGQNRRTRQSGGDRKKEKQQQVRGGVWCPVSPELCLSKEKRDKTNDVDNPDPKTERTRQQKTRPDMKRIFRKHFRGDMARKCAKTIGKSLSKT